MKLILVVGFLLAQKHLSRQSKNAENLAVKLQKHLNKNYSFLAMADI